MVKTMKREYIHHFRIILSSVLITIFLWFLIYVIGSQFYLFQVICKVGAKCPDQLEVYWNAYNWFLLFGFLCILVIYYLISAIRLRKKNI